MSDVGHITIDPVAHGSEVARHIRGTVNVGGSLVQVECDSDHDQELEVLVDRLCARLVRMAVEAVQTSLHDSKH